MAFPVPCFLKCAFSQLYFFSSPHSLPLLCYQFSHQTAATYTSHTDRRLWSCGLCRWLIACDGRQRSYHQVVSFVSLIYPIFAFITRTWHSRLNSLPDHRVSLPDGQSVPGKKRFVKSCSCQRPQQCFTFFFFFSISSNCLRILEYVSHFLYLSPIVMLLLHTEWT